MDNKSGIGYAVFCPSRETFLGKLGKWFTDVRLAAVYAEPRSAEMAANRAEVAWPLAVVPLNMSVRGIDLETAAADAKVREPKPEGDETNKGKPAPAKPVPAKPTKAA